MDWSLALESSLFFFLADFTGRNSARVIRNQNPAGLEDSKGSLSARGVVLLLPNQHVEVPTLGRSLKMEFPHHSPCILLEMKIPDTDIPIL